MQLEKIKKLIALLNENELSAIEVCEKEQKIRIEKNISASNTKVFPPLPKAEPANIGGEVDFNDMKEIKSPMVGVFYQSPSPDSPPFVKIGDKIKKGAVLCIIEAMKLMNEITADSDGEIIDICAQNGQIVDFGQTLFKIF